VVEGLVLGAVVAALAGRIAERDARVLAAWRLDVVERTVSKFGWTLPPSGVSRVRARAEAAAHAARAPNDRAVVIAAGEEHARILEELRAEERRHRVAREWVGIHTKIPDDVRRALPTPATASEREAAVGTLRELFDRRPPCMTPF
jgi:hypothetical protein